VFSYSQLNKSLEHLKTAVAALLMAF